MTGQILNYNPEALCGVVSASDGKRYDFIAAEVKGDKSEITRGAMVDFMLDEQGNMLEIYIIQAAQGQTRTTSQTTYAPNHAMEYSHGESNGEWFKSLFSFRGCYTRKQYWKMLISVIVFEYLFSLIMEKLFPSRGFFDFTSDINILIAHVLISIPIFWIMVATSVKRFHDINKSGAWWFFNFIPIIGNLVVFIMNGFVGSVRVGNNYCFNNNTTSYRSESQAVNSAKPASPTGEPTIMAAPWLVATEPTVILTPWFAALIFAPLVFLVFMLAKAQLTSFLVSSSYANIIHHSLNDIFDFGGLAAVALIASAVLVYFASEKITIGLNYKESKSARANDENGKSLNVGFLSLHPISAFLLLAFPAIVIGNILTELVHRFIYIYLTNEHFWGLILGLTGLAIYVLVMKKEITLMAMGDEGNSSEHKYTSFSLGIISLIAAPGASILLAPIYAMINSQIAQIFFHNYGSRGLGDTLLLIAVSTYIIYSILKKMQLTSIAIVKNG